MPPCLHSFLHFFLFFFKIILFINIRITGFTFFFFCSFAVGFSTTWHYTGPCLTFLNVIHQCQRYYFLPTRFVTSQKLDSELLQTNCPLMCCQREHTGHKKEKSEPAGRTVHSLMSIYFLIRYSNACL